MIGKIAITVLVVLAALLYIRHNSHRSHQLQAQRAEQAAQRRRAMTIAIALVALTLLVSAGIYSWHWQQAHQVMSVSVINSHSGKVQRYQVYRSALQGRHFRTVDGIEIHLSDAERMEVLVPQDNY